MAENFDYESIKKEAKRNERKEFFNNIKEKAIGVGNWIGEHKTEIAGAAFILIAGTKQANKMIENHREEVNRTLKVWDPKEGHHWPVRRKLTTAEFLEMESLEKKGYSKGEALKQMGLLKRR